MWQLKQEITATAHVYITPRFGVSTHKTGLSVRVGLVLGTMMNDGVKRLDAEP